MIRLPGRARWAAVIAALAATAAALALGWHPATAGRDAREHTFDVVARRYGFDPPVIRVQRGDRVRLRFASLDVVHGFHLEGYGIDVAIEPLRREVHARRGEGPLETVEEVAFVADRGGKFRYRCSRTCGAMHPFMLGELIVGPNWLWRASSAAAAGVLLGGFGLAWLRSAREGRP